MKDTNRMEQTLRTLTVATVVTWLVYLLWVSLAVVRLSEWMSASDVVPFFFIPAIMIAASLWVGVCSVSRLPVRAAIVCQAVAFSLACLFLASLLIPRAT